MRWFQDNLFVYMVLNIGFLVLIATVMSRTRPIKGLIYGHDTSLGGQLALAIFFGALSILSTYISTDVNGAIANTQSISILSAGLIGGPITGMGAALVGGLHRWLFDLNGFAAVADACAAIVGGILGAMFHQRFQDRELRNWRLMALGGFCEVFHMAIILLIAEPFEAAVQSVRLIGLPMVVLNACGVAVFIGAFNHIFVEQNSLADSRIRLAFRIADQCLPHLRQGLDSQKDMDATVEIICSLSECTGIIVASTNQVLSYSGECPLEFDLTGSLPTVALDAMVQQATCVQKKALPTDPAEMRSFLRHHILIASPLLQKGKVIGCLILSERKKWLFLEAQVGFLEGLAKLFSTQLELSQLEYQKNLLRKAEFQMLQAQVNPHFLFNSLNTISCFCREKPERARELLLMLGDYYRYAIDQGEVFVDLSNELAHVKTYLLLEQARFEERLELTLDTTRIEGHRCLVPALILQPIVENAIKHGADAQGRRRIVISAWKDQNGVSVCVADKGPGFLPQILEGLARDSLPTEKVGLSNVHKRLRSIYGEDNGLMIDSTPEGSKVTMFFPDNQEEEDGEEAFK